MERNVTMVALFAALIAVLGLVPAVTLGFGVPISAQSLGVMLAGTILGSRRGALSVILFLGLVALGLPLLAGGRGGLGVFVSPTAGFLVGFPVAAFITGFVIEKLPRAPLAPAAFGGALSGGVLVLYLFGAAGMGLVLNKTFGEALLLVVPFVPGDLIKAVLTALITSGLARTRPQSLLSRA